MFGSGTETDKSVVGSPTFKLSMLQERSRCVRTSPDHNKSLRLIKKKKIPVEIEALRRSPSPIQLKNEGEGGEFSLRVAKVVYMAEKYGCKIEGVLI